MRDDLAAYCGTRRTYIARFFASKRLNSNRAIFRDVCTEDGRLLTDHVWIRYNHPVRQLGLRDGERVIFSAEVKRYKRINNTEDVGLEDIRNIRRYGGLHT